MVDNEITGVYLKLKEKTENKKLPIGKLKEIIASNLKNQCLPSDIIILESVTWNFKRGDLFDTQSKGVASPFIFYFIVFIVTIIIQMAMIR